MSDTVSTLLSLRRDCLAAIDMALDRVASDHEPNDLRAARLVLLDVRERCLQRGQSKSADELLRAAQLLTAELR